ncbi:short transient receptor potential channel 3 [Biomphalaria glabrata]|nr:short transient receptor potential channel 3 [Biomphalaria glabrata]
MSAKSFSSTGRRAGPSRQSQYSKISQDSFCSNVTFVDIEEEFLQAAEFGDIHHMCRILKEHPELDTECSDALGRTALRMAVKNEHLEASIVEFLLERSSRHHIYEAVLQAISAGHTQIADTILKHKRYLEMWKEKRKLGATDDFYKTAYPDSQFSPDLTPLILASQKNQYEIVQLLLLRGETIIKPHKFSCDCQECQNKIKFDQLRLAKYRLNAYKGLASEAYISLSSKDPILTAFELAAELRRLSSVEKHFKREYRDLADQLSDYVVKLLDRIRSQKELELVLNKTGKPLQEKFDSLARFKLALKYKEKKFIAHPSCQQRLIRSWYHGVGKLERASWPVRLLLLLLFVMTYPVLVLLHVLFPNSKAAKILQFPFVKFTCHAVSFTLFLALIIVSTWESSQSVSKYITFRSTYNRTYIASLYGEDFPLRPSLPSVTDILLTLWIIGMVCQECHQLYQSGLREHISLYNLMDFMLLCAYIATLSLRYWTMYKFYQALDVLKSGSESCSDIRSIYWLNTGAYYFQKPDLIVTNFQIERDLLKLLMNFEIWQQIEEQILSAST